MQYAAQTNKLSIIDDLQNYKAIDLAEMNKAKLMNRIDQKYLLSKFQLIEILPQLASDFKVLMIDGILNHSYTTTYFDTHSLEMYHDHHNQRADRYKIRQRIYNSTGESFLEIKHKNNKGFTKKTRISTNKQFKHIPLPLHEFIADNTPYNAVSLKPVIQNTFYRFTLTNKKLNQRITIDTDISFIMGKQHQEMPNLVVAEVKSTRDDMDHTILDLFHQNHIHSAGMSKYSLGMAMLKPELKQNLFKRKLYLLNKINHAS